jgi:tetratricopeptide (TPR) repeat protein
LAGRDDPVRNAVRLVVAVGSFAAKPDLLTGLRSGLSVDETLRGMLAKAPASVTALAETLTEEARAVLDGFGRDLPADAPVLYEQMVVAALPDPHAIVGGAMDAERIAGAMLARLSDPEHVRPPMPELFRALTVPTLARLLAERDFADDLTPAFMAEVLGDLDRVQAGQARTEAKIDDLGARLEDIEGQSRETLEALALRFGEAAPEEMDLSALKGFLIEKAKDYRALKAEVDAIDDGLKRLSNLKAAAQDAVEQGDLEEVEALLARVQEVELDEAARTAELRADNALLRGRVDQAFALLSAAADSFAGIEAVEPARRRFEGMKRLYAHGLRYGGSGLVLGADMLRRALEHLDEDAEPLLWGKMQNNLAVALQTQGERTAGPEGADLLSEAVAAYRAALRVRTETDHPVDWAMTMQNLGNALQTQGTRTAGPEGVNLLSDAVAAHRDALRVRTEADHPVRWAMTMQNLGNALQAQGSRTAGPEGVDLLGEAVAAFRDALRVFTETDHPVDWAMTMQNLAIALRTQSERTAGPEGTDLLGAAVATFRAALRVTTEADHPVDWAMTMQNLGVALAERGSRTTGPEGADLLGEAVAAYRAALRVFTEADHPVDWAKTTQNLAIALRTQGDRTAGPEGAELLGEAVVAYRAALRVFTEADHPVDWALTQENMALAERARAEHDTCADPRPHLEAALAHVAAALTVYDPAHMGHDHERAVRLRDDIRERLGRL